MKKLSRNEMKNVMGGKEIEWQPCGSYPGQTTWICGYNGSNTQSGGCTSDICFCDGRPPVCNYPTPCSELPV